MRKVVRMFIMLIYEILIVDWGGKFFIGRGVGGLKWFGVWIGIGVGIRVGVCVGVFIGLLV